MPKTTKDTEKEELIKKKTSTKKLTASTKKKEVSTSKPTTKIAKTKAKNEIEEKTSNSTTKTTTASKKTSSTSKTKSTKTTSTKKETTKEATSTKSSISKKKTSSTTRKKSTAKKLEENIVAEYYDLPYRYNETVVKILYQTPTILFVYWDISDYDRENYIKQYGENFFNNTKPILKIYNLTKNYDFEVEINDFANSWYINVSDANCKYKVELARRTIKFEENLNTEYIYVSSSNNIEFPNDRILLDELPNKINFKNVKTNTTTIKNVSTLHLVGINKIYKVHDFYKNFYKDEILEEINKKQIITPSSSSWN